MSLTIATLLPGLLLIALGASLLTGNSVVQAICKALPRSRVAAALFFGGGALWFLHAVWHLSEADFGNFRVQLFIGFAAIAALAFFYVPDFLAVRGLCVLTLLAAMPLLDAAYMEFDHPQRLLMVGAVYVAIALAIYLGAAPYRLRDFFHWLFAKRGRAQTVGATVLAYGIVLAATAFTY